MEPETFEPGPLFFFTLLGIFTFTCAIWQALINTWRRFRGGFEEGDKDNVQWLERSEDD